jgi:hypothetical protein
VRDGGEEEGEGVLGKIVETESEIEDKRLAPSLLELRVFVL